MGGRGSREGVGREGEDDVMICFDVKVWEGETRRGVGLLDSVPAKKCLTRGSGRRIETPPVSALIEISGTF